MRKQNIDNPIWCAILLQSSVEVLEACLETSDQTISYNLGSSPGSIADHQTNNFMLIQLKVKHQGKRQSELHTSTTATRARTGAAQRGKWARRGARGGRGGNWMVGEVVMRRHLFERPQAEQRVGYEVAGGSNRTGRGGWQWQEEDRAPWGRSTAAAGLGGERHDVERRRGGTFPNRSVSHRTEEDGKDVIAIWPGGGRCYL